MRRMLRKVIPVLLCIVLLVAVVGCEDKKEDGAVAQVWSAKTTEKILADKEYGIDMKNSMTVSIDLAKGEYEGGQLLITANRDIHSIDLEVTDLVCGENKLSAENITVYFQKYFDIQTMSSPKAPVQLGKWPDALVPLENIRNKNEDKVNKGENQGLWIKVWVPTDSVAGVYTGSFELTLNGEVTSVPVSVKVWDFEIPRGHQKTTFNNFREDLIGGELDNTPEMMEVYYDWFLDYGISLYELPMLDGTAETFVNQAKKYAQDGRCNAYNMEYSYFPNTLVSHNGQSKVIYETNWDAIQERVILLAEESRPGMNLFQKLYFWDQSTDEPDGGIDRIFEANYKQDRFDEMLQQVVEELGDGFDYAAHGITKEDILQVENVVTAKESPKLPNINSYCPMINDFDTQERRDVYQKIKEEDPTRTVWWYDAWIPQYPYPNYRVEESSLGSRVMGWMQKDYDIDGLLYWGTSVYVKQGNANGIMPRNPYEDPYSFQSISMDGCLTYPGVNYGIMGPVGSIRLESIRDGLEDYEWLWLLEDLLKKAEEQYHVSFDYDNIMRNIFDSLYTGTIPNNNSNNLWQARQEVAEMIELLSSGIEGAIMVDEMNATENKAYMSVYASAGTTVKADGTVLTGETCGSGLKFTYVKELNDAQNSVLFDFENGETKVSVLKNAGRKSYVMQPIDGSDIRVTVSRGHEFDPKDHITMGANEDNPNVGEDYLKVSIAKYETDNEIAQIVYTPELSFGKAKFFDSVAANQMDKIKFNIFNSTAKDKKVILKLYSGISEITLREFVLEPGENTIEINQLYLNNWSFLDKTDRITLAFEKCDSETPDVYYIGNAYYTLTDAD